MGNSKKYYWLKLKEDFFDNKQIKFLRKLPSGSDLVIVYLKMQLKALKTEGLLAYDKIMPSCEEELALILDEDVNLVSMTVAALVKVGAIEQMDNGSLYMLAMQDLIGKEGESAERVRRFREKQSQLLLQSNTDVTNCNTEIEIEKEIEKDINKEIEFSTFPKDPTKKVRKLRSKSSSDKKEYEPIMDSEFYKEVFNTYKTVFFNLQNGGVPNCKDYKRHTDNCILRLRELGMKDEAICRMIIEAIKRAPTLPYWRNEAKGSFSYIVSETGMNKLTGNTSIQIQKGQSAFNDQERTYDLNDEGRF